MVTISKEENNFHFNVEGLHKLWALKSQLTIPIHNVVRAYQDREALNGWWKGIRMPWIFYITNSREAGDTISIRPYSEERGRSHPCLSHAAARTHPSRRRASMGPPPGQVPKPRCHPTAREDGAH